MAIRGNRRHCRRCATAKAVPESVPIHAESSELLETTSIEELLVDQLRDILHAEKQLVKGVCRKMF